MNTASNNTKNHKRRKHTQNNNTPPTPPTSPKHRYTRKINPKFGFLGFLGFLGLLGFLPQMLRESGTIAVPFPLIFFCFFGFFGFYYEGKMSGTMIDERFEWNQNRAGAIANKAALILIVGAALFSISVFKIQDPYSMLKLLLAVIGLAFGLSIFLQSYLLYRFENEDFEIEE